MPPSLQTRIGIETQTTEFGFLRIGESARNFRQKQPKMCESTI